MAKENTTQNAMAARERNIQAAMMQIEKSFGKGTIMRLGERP